MWQGLVWDNTDTCGKSMASPAVLQDDDKLEVVLSDYKADTVDVIEQPLAFADDMFDDKYGYRVHSRLKFALEEIESWSKKELEEDLFLLKFVVKKDLSYVYLIICVIILWQ